MTEIPEHLLKRSALAARTAKNRTHCWHDDGMVLTSNPPQHPQTCCNCGAKRRQTVKVTYDEGHGRFAKPPTRQSTVYYYLDDLGEQPCLGEPI